MEQEIDAKSASQQQHGDVLLKRIIGGSNNSEVYEVVLKKKGGEIVGSNKVYKSIYHNKRSVGGAQSGSADCAIQHCIECGHLQNEQNVLSVFGPHPNVVEVLDYVQSPEQCILTLKKANFDLFQLISKQQRSPKVIRSIFRNILTALSDLHDRGIQHNDIKPANVFLNIQWSPEQQQQTLTAVLGDFGLATVGRQSYEELRKAYCSRNHMYLSPEVIDFILSNDESHQQGFDEQKADVFALGATLFESMFRMRCFGKQNSATRDDLLYKYFYTGNEMKFWQLPFIKDLVTRSLTLEEVYMNEFLDLVTGMLKANPEQRLTARECLNHPWFKH